MPRATGTRIEPKPTAKTRVRKTMRFLSLKIVPKYEGNRKVIQQGAKSATMPPKNEAVRETPKKRFVFMIIILALVLLAVEIFLCAPSCIPVESFPYSYSRVI